MRAIRGRFFYARGRWAALACCAGAVVVAPSSALAAASWLPSQQLSDAGAGASQPVVAAGGEGTLVGAWQRNNAIEARVRPPGGSFSPFDTLSSSGAQTPAAAVDSQGNAIVVWERNGVIQEAFRPAAG